MTTFTESNGQRVPVRQKLTTTGETTLYTAPTSNSVRSFMEAINFCNITGSAATIDLWIDDGSSDFYLIKDHSIAGTVSLTFADFPADIRSGDTLKVQASVSNTFDVVGVIIQQGISSGVTGAA